MNTELYFPIFFIPSTSFRTILSALIIRYQFIRRLHDTTYTSNFNGNSLSGQRSLNLGCSFLPLDRLGSEFQVFPLVTSLGSLFSLSLSMYVVFFLFKGVKRRISTPRRRGSTFRSSSRGRSTPCRGGGGTQSQSRRQDLQN